MKIIGQVNSKLKDENNNLLLQLCINDYNSKKRIEDLDKEKTYQLEIKEIKSKRSLEQNKFLWKIIGDITEEMKKNDYEVDEMKVYVDLLKETNCQYEYYIVPNEKAIDKLKEVCRAVEFIKMHEVGNKMFKMVKVYLGSSKFNVNEMNMLIECALNYASELGLSYEKEYLI